jgi:Bacterial protein of unknown function (DUF885)
MGDGMTARQDQLGEFGTRLWTWRSRQQPRSRDDIVRLIRPAGWLPDWRAATVDGYRARLTEFEAEHRAIDTADAPVCVVVDHELLGSALARVRWELDVLRQWRNQPSFYVDQSIGVVFDHLLVPPPFDQARTLAILESLRAVRPMLEVGKDNLAGHAVEPFAAVTVRELAEVASQVPAAARALAAELDPSVREPLLDAAADAAAALVGFREWLAAGAGGLQPWRAVGEQELGRFLREVALIPFTAGELLELSRLEYARAVAGSAAEATRPGTGQPVVSFPDVAEQVSREAEDELAIRAFYEERGILSQPPTLGHYLTAPMPAYLGPISWLGVTDDLTSPDRLDENGVSYMPDPGPDLPYFYAANAQDPRAGIVHEGAHYQQLALSWRNPDPLRRQYYDSGPNEGIAFYNEELMLQAGLFDDSPTTRALIFSFMRLRALRVEIDVRLATGALSIDEAAAELAARVPMDETTAWEEAAFFAASPGQGLTYQVGKTQIQGFLADAVSQRGESFRLRDFHDYLWLNGNVPITLLRREYLGRTDI